MRQVSATKARRTVKSPQSTGPEKPWESFGISRASWYRRQKLAGAQLDVARLVAGGKSAAPPFNFEGMSPRAIAAAVLLRMAGGEIAASNARVSACRAVIKLSENGDDCGLGDSDSSTWTNVLGSRS
jgi:hypothetical protein